MKKIFCFLLVSIAATGVSAQLVFDALTFSPQFPKAGDKVTFQFTKNYSPLINEKQFDVAVYLFNNSGTKVLEPTLTRKGDTFSGNFLVDSNTNAIVFSFASETVKDNNKGKGYVVPIYNTNQKPIISSYPIISNLALGYGEYLFGTANDVNRSMIILEEGKKLYPDYRTNLSFYDTYLNALYSAKKKEAQPEIITELNILAAKTDLNEKDYTLMSNWYGRFKMKSAVDSINAIRNQKFPDGDWKKQELANSFYKETSAEKKKDVLFAYVAAYPPKDADTNQVNYFRSAIAQDYAREKIYTEFYRWANMLPMSTRASLYNNVSWNMAEKGTDLGEAKKMSYIATTYAKGDMANPTGKRPESVTTKQWKKNRKNTYGMYADTYGFILYNIGDYKAGLPYAKDGAEINELKNAEYNERYALLLEKSAPSAEAKKLLEQFVKNGVATSKTKNALKNIYIKENKSEDGYESYLQNLEVAAKIKKAEDLAKSMMNEPAADFNLKDFEGNAVSLASLKGKVLVVDFWATWCGPCIASMPAMKTAQEKLKSRDDVVFLFVDTWESAENKKQNAQDFMKKSNYPFYVLLDEEDKMVADYKVDGIPTKYIIDKNGVTRFKSIGFSGNDDALVDEVLSMVEMASK